MYVDIMKHVSQCIFCAQTKDITQTVLIPAYPVPTGPFEAVAIDLLQLPHSHASYVLVCVDHFSRFVVLAPLLNKTPAVVVHALVSHLICPYTTPVLYVTMGYNSQIWFQTIYVKISVSS